MAAMTLFSCLGGHTYTPSGAKLLPFPLVHSLISSQRQQDSGGMSQAGTGLAHKQCTNRMGTQRVRHIRATEHARSHARTQEKGKTHLISPVPYIRCRVRLQTETSIGPSCQDIHWRGVPRKGTVKGLHTSLYCWIHFWVTENIS